LQWRIEERENRSYQYGIDVVEEDDPGLGPYEEEDVGGPVGEHDEGSCQEAPVPGEFSVVVEQE
jgi:hypothetical protein